MNALNINEIKAEIERQKALAASEPAHAPDCKFRLQLLKKALKAAEKAQELYDKAMCC